MSLVEVYQELYNRLRKRPDDGRELQSIRSLLVSTLVEHGTYLKTVYRRNDRWAKESLQKALRYEPDNSIAHYRLGFLAYKEKEYAEAQVHFQQALKLQDRCGEKQYRLNEQQLYYANMYLANSSLHMAAQAYERLGKLPAAAEREGVAGTELSPLYELLGRNEAFLEQHAFCQITRDGRATCSKEECEDALADRSGTIMLYFGNRETSLSYEGREVALTQNQGYAMRHFLLQAADRPITANDGGLVFYRDAHHEMKSSTFRKNIERLRNQLAELALDSHLVTLQTARGMVYDFRYAPFCIMHRVDDFCD
ncbi:tetratricopeptide repeat protein [Ectobacillus ponti]|uniref:Tetratricopeptide repeat protein n=1 Tax=Ectobacillus ponti TaxID=2961894 RepID=A0AA41XBX2_9BACI|nr:tetratricopeptide repeat protein [Ectobacillus ponti]MCP8970848.1 tetratricopeptide repeat protein [Ectobacillus ponti]